MSRNLLAFSLLAIAITVIGVSFLNLQPTEAVELPNEQTAFVRSLRLTRAATSFLGKNNSAATYQFTIEVPGDAGEALKSIKIVQRNGSKKVVFQDNKSRALKGNSLSSASIPLAAVRGDSKPGEVTLVFDTPVEPGKTVTIAVKPKRNPSRGGVYLFGITAYPTGDNSPGLYLGSGRIHINQ